MSFTTYDHTCILMGEVRNQISKKREREINLEARGLVFIKPS